MAAVAASFCADVEAKAATLESSIAVATAEMSTVLVQFYESPADSGCDGIVEKLSKLAAEVVAARRSVHASTTAAVTTTTSTTSVGKAAKPSQIGGLAGAAAAAAARRRAS